MKIRNGFVSNSSSCSFCVLGFEIPRERYTYNELEELLDFTFDKHLYIAMHEENGANPNKSLIGITLSEGDEHYQWSNNDSTAQIERKVRELRKKLGVKDKIELFSGIRMC